MGQEDKFTQGSLKGQLLIDYKNGQILAYPTQVGVGVPNVMMGNFIGPGGVASPTTSGYPGGFRVAKPGFDVRTAAEANLIFNSNQNVFKIVGGKTQAITGAALSRSAVGASIDGRVVTIPHGLGFIPSVLAYVFDGTSYLLCPTMGFETSNGNSWGCDFILISADITNVYLEVFNRLFVFVAGATTQGPNTYTIKYYLLQETAN